MSFSTKTTENTPLLQKKDEPTKDATPPPAEKLSVKQLFSYATSLDYFLMLFGTICALLNGAALPLIMKVFGDTVTVFSNFSMFDATGDKTAYEELKHTMQHEANIKCIMFASIGVLSFILAFFQYASWMTSGERQSKKIREEYLKSVLRQDIGWFDSNKTGEITTRIISETLQVQEAMGEKCGQVFQYISTFFTGFILAFLNGWRLALVLISIMPILAFCASMMGFIFMSLTKKSQEAYSHAGIVAEDSISSIRTIAAFSLEKKVSKLYRDNLEAALSSGSKKGFVTGGGLGFTLFVIFSAYGLAFWYGGKLVSEGKMEPGDVLQTFLCIMIGAFSIGQASPSLNSIGEGRAVAYKIFQVINRVPPIDSFSPVGLRPTLCQGNVEFRDVTFRYPTREDVTVTRNLSFKVKSGQTLALVGSSGCGKSTVMSLLERFYDPEGGKILLDGTDIRELNIRWLRSQIGIVRQEPVLFNRTIAENIAYGQEGHCTDAEIIAAAKNANAHDFIMSLPKQYDTDCGEQGTQMSGGQKQRIAIARALVKNPKVLLLDEATSALDSQSERVLQEALDKARKGRTTIVIAHRLSTVRDADLIAVVGLGENGGGRVVEEGTHDELMALEGLYYNMVKAQELAHNDDSTVPLNKAQVFSELKSSGGRIQNTSGVSEEEDVKGIGSTQNEELLEEPPENVSLWEVAKYNLPEWPYVLIGLIAASINGITNPSFSFIFSHITNVFTQTDDADYKKNLRMWALLYVGLGLMCGVVNFLQNSMFTLAGERLTCRLRDLSFQSIVKQDIQFFDKKENSVGALTTRLSTDATLVQGMLGIRLGSMIQSIVNLCAGLGIAFYFSWKMTLVVLSALPLIAAAGFLQMKRLKGFNEQARQFYEKAGQVACECIENIRTVSVLNKETTFLRLFSENLQAPFRAGLSRAVTAGLSIGLSQLFLFGSYGLSFYYGSVLLGKQEISFLSMMTVFSAVVFTAMALGQISSLTPDVSKARTAASHMLRLIKSVPTLDTESDTIGLRPLQNHIKGNVEFENIAFKYPRRPDMTIFEDLSLGVPSNSTVALVGESGCGKSTIIGLLERFYDPLSGNISLDGHNVKDLNVKWLRQNIGLVSQEPLLFATSIRENIRHGKEDATESEIIEAARTSYAHDFIMNLPNGYDTQVGEKGTQLSGGQKQRVAIARAIVRNPRILLLDEATSALDTASEKVVQEALDKARVGRTTIVIAHRLSTIQNSDRIFVLKAGKVVEQGTHLQLMSEMGLYYSLVCNQRNM